MATPTTNNTSEAARWIPRSIEQASEAHVATTRIQPLLLMPEAGFQRALGVLCIGMLLLLPLAFCVFPESNLCSTFLTRLPVFSDHVSA